MAKIFSFTVAVPGAGKSTLFPEGFEADKYPGLYNDEGKINKKLLGKAHQRCLEQCIEKMSEETELIIQSNTNLNPEHLLKYFRACIEHDYKIQCYLPHDDLLYYEGIETREEQFEHICSLRPGIPRRAMRRMVNMFDQVKYFYRRLEAETDPRIWIRAIENPFFDAEEIDIDIGEIFTVQYNHLTSSDKILYTAHQIVEQERLAEELSMYTPVKDKLHITACFGIEQVEELFETYGPELPHTTFRILKLYQTSDRGLACLHVEPVEPRPHLVGRRLHITLWAEGYKPVQSNALLESKGVSVYEI